MEVYYVVYVFALLLILEIILSIFYSWIKKSHLIAHVNAIPGLNMNPLLIYVFFFRIVYLHRNRIIANIVLLQVVGGICQLFNKERITKLWVASRPLVFLFKPETVEVVLKSKSTIDKSQEYRFLQPWLGTGILTSTGDRWRARRKLLRPSFHLHILENFIPIYNEQSQILVEKMKRLTHKEWVNVSPLITLCTLDVICETAMGVQVNAQRFDNNEYVNALKEVGEMLNFRTTKPWYWFDSIFYLFPCGRQFKNHVKLIHNFTTQVIKKKKELFLRQRNENSLQKRDNCEQQNGILKQHRKVFLELLLEYHVNDNILSEEDIKEEVNTFMAAGFETTAISISWALYVIGLHPHVQEKIQTELESIFGKDSRPVTADDLKAMKYLDCVLKECMRLYPTIPFITRELNEDIEVLNYRVPKGTVCFILPYILHRDPEIYPNPEVFDPNRFLPENCTGRHPYAYIPFSAGPRNCIGQKFATLEEKTVISIILRNFTIKSLDGRDKVHVVANLTLRNVEPLRLKLIPRQK